MVLALVLAAGAGSRFGGDRHKLLTELQGRPVLAWAIDAAVGSGLAVAVVTGAVDVGHLVPAGVAVVENPDWADGQASSVQAGIGHAAAAGHDAVIVGLGDQPFVTSAAWSAVAASDAAIGVATYDGVRGNPVRLAAGVWPLLPTVGDAVGREVMRSRPELVREIPCPGHPGDIDTVEDLNRWS